jgi:hypothetical protein
MADPSVVLGERWWGQSSETLNQPPRPTCTVKLRGGRFNRRYAAWTGDRPDAIIAGGNNANPWQAFWEPAGDYVEMPGVLRVMRDQAFENNGLTVLTLDMENIGYPEQGVGSNAFHMIERGWYAPYRGYNPPDRPGWDPTLQNDWYLKLAKNAQITVWEGYDGEEAKCFTGLIDDIDLTSHPDRITITARDFGQVFTDQRMFGNVKDPYLRDPVTFVDRRTAEKLRKVGYDAKAASQDISGQYPPHHVLDSNKSTYWRSRKYSSADATDWIQIRVPQGRYQTFYLWPRYAGMRAYFSLYAKPRSDGKPSTFGGSPVSEGWVGGIGTVPGAEGGVPYVKELGNLANQGHYHTLGEGAPAFECGAGSIIRVSFRDLAQVDALDNPPGEPVTAAHRAGVTRMVAIKRSLSSEALKKRWVLVDDVADAVKVIFRWAGFKEWDVESTGVRLKRPVVFNRGDFLVDAINKLAESTNYVVFMNDPTPADDSIGVPTFRQSRVITEDPARAAIDDKNLLTGIRVKISDEPLSYSIRVRGRAAEEDEAGAGFLIGGGDIRRVKFTFYPPWSGHGGSDQLAGILKHVVHQDPKLTSTEDCQFACYYIALAEALKEVTGTAELPGFPAIELDSFIQVRDVGTGMWTRLWVAHRTSTYEATGKKRSYKATASGTWVDTPNVIAMKGVIQQALLHRSHE